MSTNRTSNMPSGLDQQGRRQTRISAADPLFHGDHDTPTLLPGDTDGFGFQPAKGRPMPEWVARSHQALQRREPAVDGPKHRRVRPAVQQPQVPAKCGEGGGGRAVRDAT